jgi:uncharacterized protein (UPF0332 family)
MKLNLDECFRKRLLRKDFPDPEKSRISLIMSKNKLGKAREALEKDMFDASLIFSYTSMFHSARALLFKDGIVEKNHYCVILYLLENYVNKGKLEQKYINILDHLRMERHDSIYGLDVEGISQEEAEDAILGANDFLNIVKNMLNI